MAARRFSARVVGRWVGVERRGVARAVQRWRAGEAELGEDGCCQGFVFDDGEDVELACALWALEDVDVERAAHQRVPVDAWGRGEKRAGLQAVPVMDAEDVGRERLGAREEHRALP